MTEDTTTTNREFFWGETIPSSSFYFSLFVHPDKHNLPGRLSCRQQAKTETVPRLPEAGISKDMDKKSLFLGSINSSFSSVNSRPERRKRGRQHHAAADIDWRKSEKNPFFAIASAAICALPPPTTHSSPPFPFCSK